MVEWSITPVLKTGVPRGTGGSNPSLSAIEGNPTGCLLALFKGIIFPPCPLNEARLVGQLGTLSGLT